MIGAITFYSMRGSLSSGEYPLLSSGQDLSSYQVAQFPRVKYRDGMQVSAEVPAFSGIENANVAEIGGRYYWVTQYEQRTAESNQYTVTLDFMGPTSLYMAGDDISGNWHKTPTNVCQYLKNAVTNSMMAIAETYYLSDLDCPDMTSDIPTFWVQVTGITGSTSIIKSYGCFVPYRTDADQLDIEIVHAAYDTNKYYPNAGDIIRDIKGSTGILAENILDISISRRCPYQTVTASSGGSEDFVRLRGSTEPVEVGDYSMYMYDLTQPQRFYKAEYSHTISLTAMQRAIGEISLKDWNNNTIMSIPTNKGNPTITASIETDMNGLYLAVSCQEQTIRIPEGKLPYIGSNWDTYKAYRMDTDRLIMENSIEAAKFNRETQQITGTVNGIISGVQTGIMTGLIGGNVAGAVTGIAAGVGSTMTSLWSADRAYQLERRQAEFQNDLSRRQAVAAPETQYSTGYGTIYAEQNINTPVKIALMMPYDISTSYYDSWTAENGYPAEGIFDVTATTGFYQGKLISGEGGMWYDRCNEVFMKGFKFVTP